MVPAVQFLLSVRTVTDAIAKAAAVGMLLAAVLAAACSSTQKTIQQQQEKLASLGATTQAIGEAWLARSVSATYAKTALEQTFVLVEQARTALAARPQTLLDARAARLAQSAEQLSRLIAAMIHDVEGSDTEAVRRRLTSIPLHPEGS